MKIQNGTQNSILEIIANNPGIESTEIKRELQVRGTIIGDSAVSKYLKLMYKAGKVAREKNRDNPNCTLVYGYNTNPRGAK